jgi:chemotaxis protein MotA
MNGLKENKYLSPPKNIIDPISVLVSTCLLIAALMTAVGFSAENGQASEILYKDLRSFFFVLGGTFACLLFQFNFAVFLQVITHTFRSIFINPINAVTAQINELDEIIITGDSIFSLRTGDEITGELLNDIVHMAKEKLFYEEIEELIANKVASIYLTQKVTVSLLNKGAKIAPSLGLLGTVIGLIEVLQSLNDPSMIGPAMSLALMTTAFGSILGSLIFTPLAGRLENHNTLYVETHKLLMNRVNILLQRENRRLNPVTMNVKLESAK